MSDDASASERRGIPTISVEQHRRDSSLRSERHVGLVVQNHHSFSDSCFDEWSEQKSPSQRYRYFGSFCALGMIQVTCKEMSHVRSI